MNTRNIGRLEQSFWLSAMNQLGNTVQCTSGIPWLRPAADAAHDRRPNVVVDGHVEERVDEAVQVHHHHDEGQVGLFEVLVAGAEEEDEIWSDTDEEDYRDGGHHYGDLPLLGVVHLASY